MVSYPNSLCLLEGVKTDMKPVGFQGDLIQILTKMKIMKGRDEKEVRELFGFSWGKRRKRVGGQFTILFLFHGFCISLFSAEKHAGISEPLE